MEYKGTKAITKYGKQCQSWPHSFLRDRKYWIPDSTIEDAENFCRNPNKRKLGPWCFTSLDAEREWEYCNIPHCNYVHISTGTKKAYTIMSYK